MPRPDDFSRGIKLTLAKRVGFKCSNPQCTRPTSGPTLATNDGSVNMTGSVAKTPKLPNSELLNGSTNPFRIAKFRSKSIIATEPMVEQRHHELTTKALTTT